jgi:hypothetical protein
MLQVCVDYLELLGSQEDIQLPHQISAPAVPNYSADVKDLLEWYCEVKGHPCSAFRDYAARYWVALYQDVSVGMSSEDPSNGMADFYEYSTHIHPHL